MTGGVLLLAAMLMLGGASHAFAGDLAAGKRKALACQTCHGLDGLSKQPEAPNLAGQPYQYLLQALHEYREGERSVPVMRAAAGPLTEKDMQALAHWYAAQTPCKPVQAENP